MTVDVGNLWARSVFFTLPMTRSTLTALLAALLALALVPAVAAAKKRKPNHLWATVNVCDTQKHPDRMGLRARMPGNGTHERMYIRFTAQYHDKGRWKRVKGARSGWDFAGSALYRWKESGITFRFTKPKAGTSYLMRGYAEFQWRKKRAHRRGWRVVRRTHRITSGGHRGTRDADPKGFSAARCRIATPPA
jgi:hypothetical protein